MKLKKISAMIIVIVMFMSVFAGYQRYAYAVAAKGIYNNGLGGINININSSIYTNSDWALYGDPYGSAGCTWFVGARVMELTGKGGFYTMSPEKWYSWYGESLGFTKGSTPRAKSVICWSTHVAYIEKIVGTTAYISEGGMGYLGADYGCSRITTLDISKIPSQYTTFLGYVYLGEADTTKPVISNITISEINAEGYTVSCTVTDNVNVASVKFPTWTLDKEVDNQDDIIWGDPTDINGNIYSYRVNRADHNEEYGDYLTHIYAYDSAGNEQSAACEITKVENAIGSQTLADGEYIIHSAIDDNYVLDVYGASIENNAAIKLTVANGGNNQRFKVKYLGDGYYNITSVFSEKNIQVADASSEVMKIIEQYEKTDDISQKWIIKEDSDGYYNIITPCGSNYVTVAGSAARGRTVYTHYKDNSPSQKWRFENKSFKAAIQVNDSTNAQLLTIGDSVNLTASATEGTGNYTYQFMMKNMVTGADILLKDYNTIATYTGPLVSAGTKQFYVNVKDSSGIEVSSTPVSIVVTSELAAKLRVNGGIDNQTVKIGENVILTAGVSGGISGYTYKYVMKNVNTGQTITLKDYSSSISYTGPITSAGTKQFTLYVKDSRGKEVVSNTITVTALDSNELKATVKINNTTSDIKAIVGDLVSYKASATGGSGNYLFKYVVRNVSTGIEYTLKDYSDSLIYEGELTGSGIKELYIYVKDSNGTCIKSNVVTVNVSK